MADDWDAEDFEPEEVKVNKVVSDKWDGEDEEDEVKDAWDAENNENNKDESSDLPKAVQVKKKKKLADIIAEKEAVKEAELEAKRKQAQAQTPEGRLAEKMRQQKIEENSNLQLAKDMLGLPSGSVDGQTPVTKEEFAHFEKSLTEKITLFSSSEHYPDFVDNLVKNISLDLNSAALKKIKMNIEALFTTKLKDEKAQAAKAKKNKGKAGTLKMDISKDIYSANAGAEYDELDDFM